MTIAVSTTNSDKLIDSSRSLVQQAQTFSGRPASPEQTKQGSSSKQGSKRKASPDKNNNKTQQTARLEGRASSGRPSKPIKQQQQF